MDFRKLNITFTNAGKGQIGTRLSLPTKWVKQMEITKEDRGIVLSQVSTALVITKTEISEEDYVKLEKILKKYV